MFLILIPVAGASSTFLSFTYDDNQVLLASPPYLWAGTTGGLVRYEIGTGKRINLTTLEGLPSMNVLSLSAYKDGGVYAGTLGEGLAVINKEGKILQIMDQIDGLSDSIVMSVIETGNTIYVGTGSGIYYYGKRSFLKLTDFPMIQVNDIKIKGESIFAATPLGLYEIPIKTKKPRKIEVPGFKGGILCLASTPTHLYLGTNQGVIRLKTESSEVSTLGVKEGLPVSTILSLKVDGGKVYIGTQRGLRVSTEDLQLLNLSLPHEVKDVPIQSLEVTGEYLFTGTSKGLVRLLKTDLTKRLVFGSMVPLYSNRITALHKHKNNIFLGTSKGLSFYSEDFGYIKEVLSAVEVTGLGALNDDLYVASTSGLYRLNIPLLKVIETYDVRKGLFHNQIFDLKVLDGEIYLATRLGVQIFDPVRKRFEAFFLRDVLSLCIKPDLIYAGTLKGLYSKGTVDTEFKRVGGSFSPDTTIRSLTSSTSSLFLATPEGILEYREDRGTFTYLKLPQVGTIYSMLEENHFLFIAAEKGFIVYDFINGSFIALNNLDSLPSDAVLSFFKELNKIYLGTANGLLVTTYVGASKSVFYDISMHSLRRAIEEAAKNGIVKGFPDKSFRPDGITTRAQFSVMLLKTLGVMPPLAYTSSFIDVSTKHWAAPYIEELVKRGVVSKGGSFRPNTEIRREEAAEWIVRLLKFPLVKPTSPTFRDVPPTSPFYSFIETTKKEEIFLGTPQGNFLPKFPLSRAEAVTVLRRIRNERL